MLQRVNTVLHTCCTYRGCFCVSLQQWQLTLGQHILVRSAKDNQWYPGVILDISYRNYLPVSYSVLSPVEASFSDTYKMKAHSSLGV